MTSTTKSGSATYWPDDIKTAQAGSVTYERLQWIECDTPATLTQLAEWLEDLAGTAQHNAKVYQKEADQSTGLNQSNALENVHTNMCHASAYADSARYVRRMLERDALIQAFTDGD